MEKDFKICGRHEQEQFLLFLQSTKAKEAHAHHKSKSKPNTSTKKGKIICELVCIYTENEALKKEKNVKMRNQRMSGW